MKRDSSIMMSVLLLASMLAVSFTTRNVEATGTVYIMADGSIDSPTAPIQREGGTYTISSATGVSTVQADTPVEAVEEWVARYDDPTHGHDYPCAIAVDDSGNVYVTGAAGDAWAYSDYATIKYDPNGSQLWVRTYGFDDVLGTVDSAVDLAADGSGNVYVTGASYMSYATVKYNTNGNQLWVSRYHGPYYGIDCASAIAVDDSNNVYVTGTIVDSSGSYDDFGTIKYDPNGNELWVKRYTSAGDGYDGPTDLTVDASGNVYVTGYSKHAETSYYDYVTVKYNAVGTELWVVRYDGPGNGYDKVAAIVVDDSNNVYVTGRSAGSGTSYDYATIKYDTVGNELWVKRYNGVGSSPDEASAIALDRSGNVYVTGYSQGPTHYQDYATVKYDTNGNELWVRRYNGTGNYVDLATAVAVDDSNSIYVTGSSYGNGTDNDYATVKYDTNGNELWVRRYDNAPGLYGDKASAIAVDSSYNVYVTGSSYGNGTGQDYATVKYSQDKDGDGLPDVWEIKGIDSDGDGTIDLDLPALGADWKHKDLFLEIDYMGSDGTHDHRPDANAVSDVINSFRNAPVNNPDGVNGITLHIEVDEEIVHQNAINVWGDFDNIKSNNFGTVTQRGDPNNANILAAKRLVYRYALFIHQFAYGGVTTTASGIAELPGNDFIVSLGEWFDQYGVATRDDQAGTLMHELGHTLSLRHGGGDNINGKPNYLSIMSYTRQFSNFIPNRPLDYSRDMLPNLNESDLNEAVGINGPPSDRTVHGPLFFNITSGEWEGFRVSSQGPIDWNRDGDTQDIGVARSINDFTSAGFGDNILGVLEGYNDWANLLYGFRGTAEFADGVHINVADQEITWEIVEQMRNTIIIGFHDVAITNLVPSKTVVGQGYSLNISVTATNQGDYAETFNVTAYYNLTGYTQPQGLVGYWKFNEGSGTMAYDSSDQNNHGTLVNDPIWLDGKIGKALSFDGVDDYVDAPDSPSLDMVGNMTVEAWIYPKSYGKTLDEWGEYHAGIVSKNGLGDQTYKLTFAYSNQTSTSLHFEIQNTTNWLCVNPIVSPTLNKWHHVAGVYDGNYLRVYLDGVEIANKYVGYHLLKTNDQSLKIGRDAYTPSGRRFDGLVDEVRIYNRALSRDEIIADMMHYGTIGTETVNLESGNSTTLTFTWNTGGFAYGNYTISAVAALPSDADPADNTFVDGKILVTITGDINGDQWVNAKDAVLLGGAFYPTGTYNPNADINGDDYCNAKDAVLLGSSFGQSWP